MIEGGAAINSIFFMSSFSVLLYLYDYGFSRGLETGTIDNFAEFSDCKQWQEGLEGDAL